MGFLATRELAFRLHGKPSAPARSKDWQGDNGAIAHIYLQSGRPADRDCRWAAPTSFNELEQRRGPPPEWLRSEAVYPINRVFVCAPVHVYVSVCVCSRACVLQTMRHCARLEGARQHPVWHRAAVASGHLVATSLTTPPPADLEPKPASEVA